MAFASSSSCFLAQLDEDFLSAILVAHCTFQPFLVLCLVGGYAFALQVGFAQCIFSIGILLCSRFLEPLYSFLAVLGHALAVFVAAAQPVLCFLVAFLCGGLQFGECLGVVLGIIEFLTLFVESVESGGYSP